MKDGIPGATQGLLHRVGRLPGEGGKTGRCFELMIVIQRGH
jgi:hypothetical protein